MPVSEMYDQAFIDALGVSANQLGPKLVYKSISTWDSIGHMELIAMLEDSFGIEMEAGDILDFRSYERGKQILEDKYGIEFKYHESR